MTSEFIARIKEIKEIDCVDSKQDLQLIQETIGAVEELIDSLPPCVCPVIGCYHYLYKDQLKQELARWKGELE